jgi:3-oxoadipate enol-lactonase
MAGARSSSDAVALIGETVVLGSGAMLHARIVGSGPPLVLVGGLGDDHTLWDPLLPGLSADHRCLSFDNRGAGQSSPAREPYVIEGCSMGGAIAQEWVLHHPGDATALVLISTWGRTDDTFAAELERFIALARAGEAAALEHALLAACLVTEPAAGAAGPGPPGAAPLDLDGFQAQAEACLGHDTSDRLGDIRVPTCVIASERDALINPRQSRLLAARVPQASLHLTDTGHVPFWERPDEVLAIVREFLAGL